MQWKYHWKYNLLIYQFYTNFYISLLDVPILWFLDILNLNVKSSQLIWIGSWASLNSNELNLNYVFQLEMFHELSSTPLKFSWVEFKLIRACSNSSSFEALQFIVNLRGIGVEPVELPDEKWNDWDYLVCFVWLFGCVLSLVLSAVFG
jgi:hypothetical protein